MSRKHYVAIAAVIARIGDDVERINAALSLASIFANDNRNFDRARFLSACKAD